MPCPAATATALQRCAAALGSPADTSRSTSSDTKSAKLPPTAAAAAADSSRWACYFRVSGITCRVATCTRLSPSMEAPDPAGTARFGRPRILWFQRPSTTS